MKILSFCGGRGKDSPLPHSQISETKPGVSFFTLLPASNGKDEKRNGRRFFSEMDFPAFVLCIGISVSRVFYAAPDECPRLLPRGRLGKICSVPCNRQAAGYSNSQVCTPHRFIGNSPAWRRGAMFRQMQWEIVVMQARFGLQPSEAAVSGPRRGDAFSRGKGEKCRSFH